MGKIIWYNISTDYVRNSFVKEKIFAALLVLFILGIIIFYKLFAEISEHSSIFHWILYFYTIFGQVRPRLVGSLRNM